MRKRFKTVDGVEFESILSFAIIGESHKTIANGSKIIGRKRIISLCEDLDAAVAEMRMLARNFNVNHIANADNEIIDQETGEAIYKSDWLGFNYDGEHIQILRFEELDEKTIRAISNVKGFEYFDEVKDEAPADKNPYEVDWSNAPKWADAHVFHSDHCGAWIQHDKAKPDEFGGWSKCSLARFSEFTLAFDLSWKQSLTTRPEAIHTEQPKSEPSIDEQIEAARAELERLKKIKEREVAIPLNWFNNDNERPVFKGLRLAPNGLESRCLMFKTSELELRTQQHNEYTVLTFYNK
jgi:hypothetical protein